jgi:phospholipase/carboxylesterase
MQYTERTIGELNCTIADTEASANRPQALFIVCHGFGAPGTDLVPLAEEICEANPAGTNGVRFVFPMAPLRLEEFGDYDARAWWPIDMMRLQIMIQTGQIRDLRSDRPPLLENRVEQLSRLIRELQSETGLGSDRTVLGGFSQGAMLTTETALRFEPPVAGLVVWSGTLLSEDIWREAVKRRRELRVVQTHGTLDPILPFAAATWLRDMFVDAGIDLRFASFPGPHTIAGEGIRLTADLLARVIAESGAAIHIQDLKNE